MSIAPATFARLPGDHATYTSFDPEMAVRLGRAGTIAVDIETAGLNADAWNVKAISIGTTTEAVVLDPNDPRQKVACREAIALATTVLMHNATFDAPIMVTLGFMRHADVWKVRDTLVSARLAFPGETVSKSLGVACERYLGGEYGRLKKSLEHGYIAVAPTGFKSKHAMFQQLGLGSAAYRAYAAFDVVMTARLDVAMPKAVADRTASGSGFVTPGDPEYLLHREQTVNRMLLAASCRGLAIDFDVVDELQDEMRGQVFEADKVLKSYGVETEDTPAKVKDSAMLALHAAGALPAGHRWVSRGKDRRVPSADQRGLKHLAHAIIEALEPRSQALRFSTDYADKIVGLAFNGRIHPQVGVLVAVTGRMSYSAPPLQQYPAAVRRMMKFDGDAVSMDWSSIEPVFFANAVGETALIEVFEQGGDLYIPVAEAAGVTRKDAKVILLAQLYGQGPAKLAGSLGRDEDEAREVVGAVMGRMPRVRDAIKKLRGYCDTVGQVSTMSGRVLPIAADPRSGNRRFMGYLGVNYFVQGSCYDMLSESMFAMHEAGLSDALYAAVHDELVVADEAAADVQRIMETPPPALVAMAGREPVLRVGRSDLGRYWLPKE